MSERLICICSFFFSFGPPPPLSSALFPASVRLHMSDGIFNFHWMNVIYLSMHFLQLLLLLLDGLRLPHNLRQTRSAVAVVYLSSSSSISLSFPTSYTHTLTDISYQDRRHPISPKWWCVWVQMDKRRPPRKRGATRINDLLFVDPIIPNATITFQWNRKRVIILQTIWLCGVVDGSGRLTESYLQSPIYRGPL